MFSGKIAQPADWQHVLQAILDAPIIDDAVLTIVADQVSGSIRVRQGRYLAGAYSSTGHKGAAALRQLMSLTPASFGYLERGNASRSSLKYELELNVDIHALLAKDPEPSAAPAQVPAAQATPAELATAELRRTIHQLRPVSSYPSKIPPPPPAGGPVPRPAQEAPAASAQPAAPAEPLLTNFEYDSDGVPVVAGSGRKRVNPLDKLIYGAASTCMKLTSLSARRKEEQQQKAVAKPAAKKEEAPYQHPLEISQQMEAFRPPEPPQPLPHQSHQHLEVERPLEQKPAERPKMPDDAETTVSMFLFPREQALERPKGGLSGALASRERPSAQSSKPKAKMSDGPQKEWPRDRGQGDGKKPALVLPPVNIDPLPPIDPAQAQNLTDSLRATAWRLASRVAYEAKARMDGDRQRLRTVDSETSESREAEKSKRAQWPPDPGSIALILSCLAAIGVIAGGIWIAHETGGTRPYINGGKRYLSQGKTELAINQFTLAVQKNPSDAEALQLRAESYEKLKEYNKASADYLRLAQLQPNSQGAARKAAYYQFEQRNYDAAIKVCNRLLSSQPDDNSTKALLAMNLARSGSYQSAIAAAAKIDKQQLPSYLVPDFLGSLGFAYVNTKDTSKAIESYSRALKADPKNELILAERAQAYMKSKDYKHAEADYGALVKLFPSRAGAYTDFAKAAYMAGDYAGAARAYDKAIKFSPHPEFYLRLADCHKALGKWGYVIADCDNALSLQPSNSEAARLRAVAMTRAKKEKAIVIPLPADNVVATVTRETDAKGHVRSVVTDPETESAYNILVGGNAQKALPMLRAIVKRTPQDTNARHFLATASLETGRPREALDQFNALTQMGALLPSDELPYAKAAEAAGSADRAIEIYIKALDRDPTQVQARVNLIKLCVAKGYQDKAAGVATEGFAIAPASKDAFKNALMGK